MAHEIGHSIGLMHNFGASDDAINYFQYWEIRSSSENGDGGVVGPRINDPMTIMRKSKASTTMATAQLWITLVGMIDGTGLGR